MQIATIEAIPIEVGVKPLNEKNGIAPYVSNHGRVETRERMLIRLETDDGETGWGEMLVTLESASATKTIIEDVIAPKLVGRDVHQINSFIQEFYFPYVKIHPFLGGVEMALWDVHGKQERQPIHQMLGGKLRDTVPTAFCLGILSPEESRSHAREAVEAGFTTLKTKAGHDWRTDVERLTAMYQEVDGELEFRLDPNQGWTVEEVVRATAMLEDRGIYLQYLEQPIRIDTYGSVASLRNRLRTPIGVNEDTYLPRNLLHLLNADAIDVAVIDLVPAGGILAAKKLAAIASDAGISMAHHCGFDLGIKTAAMLQLVSTTAGINLPSDTVYYAWEDTIIEEPFTFDNGELRVPNGDGLGVTVDEEAVEELRIDT